MSQRPNKKRHARNYDLSTKPETDILAHRHVFILFLLCFLVCKAGIHFLNSVRPRQPGSYCDRLWPARFKLRVPAPRRACCIPWVPAVIPIVISHFDVFSMVLYGFIMVYHIISYFPLFFMDIPRFQTLCDLLSLFVHLSRKT